MKEYMFTDQELTEIYKEANNEAGKARPLTTERIFKAMRAAAQKAVEREFARTPCAGMDDML